MTNKDIKETTADPTKVFVVHGRNEKIRLSMFEFLRSLGLHPIEWGPAMQMTGKSSPYIGDVITNALNKVQAVLVIFTGDDEGHLRSEFQKPDDPEFEKKITPQARLNVIFEAGMAWSLCPNRTILVQIGECRPMSDISGVVISKFDGSAKNRNKLALQLETAGCKIDKKGDDWLKVGDFEIVEKPLPQGVNPSKEVDSSFSIFKVHDKMSVVEKIDALHTQEAYISLALQNEKYALQRGKERGYPDEYNEEKEKNIKKITEEQEKIKKQIDELVDRKK
jgi:predicted nucleotide-binding protein